VHSKIRRSLERSSPISSLNIAQALQTGLRWLQQDSVNRYRTVIYPNPAKFLLKPAIIPIWSSPTSEIQAQPSREVYIQQ
jgi:hypothetical protein